MANRKENDLVTLAIDGFIDSPQGYTNDLIEIEIEQTGTIIKVEENDFYHVILENGNVILIEGKDLK